MEDLHYDAHVHTDLSDGKDGIADNIRAGVIAGLECMAITDHNWISGLDIPEYVRAIREAEQGMPISVLAGVEATILDTEGRISLNAEAAGHLQIVLADFSGVTRGIAKDPPVTQWRLVENVLAAIENAAANPIVDAIAHPFNLGRWEAKLNPSSLPVPGLKRVAAAMVRHDVAFEIMNQMPWWYPEMTVAEFEGEYEQVLRIFADAGVKFLAGSDAHSCGAVGNLRWVQKMMAQADIGRSQLVNLRALGELRLKKGRGVVTALHSGPPSAH
jgi:histidinol phosphatase-like PHP family hydrolase